MTQCRKPSSHQFIDDFYLTIIVRCRSEPTVYAQNIHMKVLRVLQVIDLAGFAALTSQANFADCCTYNRKEGADRRRRLDQGYQSDG